MSWWQIFFSLFIFFLPTQLGRHFWPSYAYVFGLRVDYLSPTLYLTDILLVSTLFYWLRERRRGTKGIRGIKREKELIVVLVFSLANIFWAKIPILSFWKWLRVGELIALVYFVFQEGKFVQKTLSRFLPWLIIYESIIGVGQFLEQSSLGGFFWFLGERTFSLLTPGIAKGELWGRLFLRPYGTFSHPNSLAGFILVCLILIVFAKKLSKIQMVAVLLGGIVLILSFARLIWLTTLMLIPYLLLRKNIKQKKVIFFIFLLLVISLSVFLIKNSAYEESYQQRLELNQAAFKLVKQSPLIGVGLNNFIPVMVTQKNFGQVYWLQPVHNIYLLVAAETGLIGLVVFLFFILKLFKKTLAIKNLKLTISLLSILLTGLFDHYWLTLPQNFLLGGIIVGLVFNS